MIPSNNTAGAGRF